MRQRLALVAGAAAAAFGALILGEYDPHGATPYVAGVLFGVAIGEVVVATAGRATDGAGAWLPAAVAAAEAAAGLVWAAWIAEGHVWSYVPGSAWLSVAIGAAAAGLWVRTAARSRSTDGSPNEP